MSAEKKVVVLDDVDIFSDLKDSVVRRLLRKAYLGQKEDSLPMHRRKSGGKDDLAEDSDDENDSLVELDQSRGKPNPIPVAEEDLPESVKLPPKATKGKKA